MNIMIHVCKEREWFVGGHLIPAIKEQASGKGINVRCYVDSERMGNQKAFLHSAKLIAGEEGDTWHLQDDVWPSGDFFETISAYKDIPGIICGFGTRTACRGKSPGWTTACGMYTSFQCIRIPNRMLTGLRQYVFTRYGKEVATDKWDDALFAEYLLRKAPYYPVLNLAPSIVEHVDYIIGGSVINKQRKYRPTAIEFDQTATEQLIERLRGTEHEYHDPCLH